MKRLKRTNEENKKIKKNWKSCFQVVLQLNKNKNKNKAKKRQNKNKKLNIKKNSWHKWKNNYKGLISKEEKKWGFNR